METVNAFKNEKGFRKSYFRIGQDRVGVDGKIFEANPDDFYDLRGGALKIFFNDVIIQDNEVPDKLMNIYDGVYVNRGVYLQEDENRFRVCVRNNSYTMMQRKENGGVTWAGYFNEDLYLDGQQFILCEERDIEFVLYKESGKALLRTGKNRSKVQMINYGSLFETIDHYLPTWYKKRMFDFLIKKVNAGLLPEAFPSAFDSKVSVFSEQINYPEDAERYAMERMLPALLTWSYVPGLQFLNIWQKLRKDLELTDGAIKRLKKAHDMNSAYASVFPHLNVKHLEKLSVLCEEKDFWWRKELSLFVYLIEDGEVLDSLFSSMRAKKEKVSAADRHHEEDFDSVKHVSYHSIRKMIRKLGLQKRFDEFMAYELDKKQQSKISSFANVRTMTDPMIRLYNACIRKDADSISFLLYRFESNEARVESLVVSMEEIVARQMIANMRVPLVGNPFEHNDEAIQIDTDYGVAPVFPPESIVLPSSIHSITEDIPF